MENTRDEIKRMCTIARARTGLTYDELSEKLNVKKGDIRKWEGGRTVPKQIHYHNLLCLAGLIKIEVLGD